MKKEMMEQYESFREKKAHGEQGFPFNIYPCAIPDLFPEVLPHWHDEMEIIFIKKGQGIVTVDFDSRTLQAPSVVFILPGQLHAIRQFGKERMEYENIIFHTRLLFQKQGEMYDNSFLIPLFEGRLKIPSFVTRASEHYDELTEPLAACDQAAEKKVLGYPLLVKSQLFLLCYRFYSLYPLEETKGNKKELLDRIKPVLTYVEEHYGDKITVAEAAAKSCFSEAHFMRFFKANMGMSFVSYLKEYRLSKSEEMIRKTDKNILYIAEECGFKNFSYFIRSFKGKYGVTPLKYRRRLGRTE